MNWYLSDRAFLPLSPAHAFPEGASLPFKPIVMHRVKEHAKARGVDF